MQIHRMWFYWGETTSYEAKVLFYQHARGAAFMPPTSIWDPLGEAKCKESVP